MTGMISGDSLRRSLERAGMTQAELARRIHVDPGVVNRWVRGRVPLRGSYAHTVAGVLRERGITVNVDPDCRVFLSSPMASLSADGYEQVRADAAAVHEVLADVAAPVYWPAGGIAAAARFEAPDLATERNLTALAECEAFVFLQTSDIGRPSSCHIELGMAIAMHKPITVFAPDEGVLPYMLRRYEAVASRQGGWYRFYPSSDAIRLLEIHGPELLGLPAAQVAA